MTTRIDDMLAGHESDAVVAEKVLDYQWWHSDVVERLMPPDSKYWAEEMGYTPGRNFKARYSDASAAPCCTTEHAAAWLVVEHLRMSRGWQLTLTTTQSGIDVLVNRWNGYDHDGDVAAWDKDNPALAICRAALKALGIEEVTV